MTYDELMLLAKQAKLDPWEFFKTHSLKELQIASHPDKLRCDSSDLFASFAREFKRSETPPVMCGSYPLFTEIAVGDLRIVHASKDCVVKIPRITGRSANKLASSEAEILTTLAERAKGTSYGAYIPQLVEEFIWEKKQVVCTSYPKEIFALNQFGKLEPCHVGWIVNRALTALGFIHYCGYAHCAVTPEHLMIAPENHAGVLTGWIHAQKLGDSLTVVPSTRKDWYSGKTATIALDLALLGHTILEVSDLPKRMKNFARALILGVNVDAWTLQEDWSAILVDIFGAPKFRELKYPVI